MNQLPLTLDRQSHTHLVKLACQGEVKAIETLMNRHLIRQQMTAQVQWQENRLHILIEAIRVPSPEALISAIQRTLLKLQVPTLRTFKVSCQKAGSRQLAWTHEQEIGPNSTVHSNLAKQEANPTRQPTATPISLQDWLSQKAQTSLAELIQPIPATTTIDTEVRFLRFSFGSAETALLPLSSIRQMMKVHLQSLVKVPDMPEFVVGIGNFRGEMLWMVDLGLQLGVEGATLAWNQSRSQPHSSSVVTPSYGNLISIVIQIQGKSLGLIVPLVIDIERHDAAQLQSPTQDLFPANLLPFIQFYLEGSHIPILDANKLIADHRFQIHPIE